MEPGCFYHIYNRGNNRERIFYEDENYRFFLRRYRRYLASHIDTYAYCLMPNHFHLLIKVKDTALRNVHLAHSRHWKKLSGTFSSATLKASTSAIIM